MVLQVVGHPTRLACSVYRHATVCEFRMFRFKLGGGENSGRRNGLTGLPHFNVARVDRISHLILALSCL
jgi:hypothetical protein